MAATRIPVEIDARMGPRALEDFSRALTELGYEPSSGASDGQVARAGEGPELELKVGEALGPDAQKALLQGVSNWIKQRPAPKGRFRRKRPRPVSVTIYGPNGDLLGRAMVERD